MVKTIKGICELYCVGDYVCLEDRIAVYNVRDDNFHIFRWASNRYILSEVQVTIPNWLDNKVGIA